MQVQSGKNHIFYIWEVHPFSSALAQLSPADKMVLSTTADFF